MDVGIKRLYEFGPYRLNAVKRVLAKDGNPVPLTPKAFDTLLMLVENRGTVVEKDDLMNKLWPDSFVEEGNLTVNISVLRKALGESQNHHPYIVTMPGRGYQFVASVREVWDDGVDLIVEEHTRSRLVIDRQESESIETRGAWRSRLAGRVSTISGRLWSPTRRVQTISVVVLSLLVIVLLLKQLVPSSPRPAADWRSSLKFIRVAGLRSDRNEDMNTGRLSPDGRLFVFSSTGDGLNLWIRQIGGGQPIQITKGDYHDDSPIWSPNQQRIAFISDRANQVAVWTVPSLGGEPPTQLRILDPSDVTLNGNTGLISWSKDERTIYVSWKNNAHAIDVRSGEMRQITNFELEPMATREFRISPDENWIAYVDKNKDQYDIWRLAMGGGTPIQVTNDTLREHRPVWHPDGKRILYSARLDGRFRLYEAYVDGRPPELIAFTEDESYIWDVSSDGKELLYYGKRDESDLWEIDVSTKEETQLTSDIGLEFWPQPSPKGGSLAFNALQGEKVIWEPRKSALLVSAVGPNQQPITLTSSGFEAQWSPDGVSLAFLRETDGIDNLFTIRAAGGEERQLTERKVFFGGSTIGPPFNRFSTTDFSWSPDGARIAFCSSEKDGPPNLWIISADGSNETRITENTDPNLKFSCPIWSPDGRRIAYLTRTPERPVEGNQVWSLWSTDLHKSDLVFHSESVLRLLGWSAEGEDLIVAAVENKGMNRAFPAEVRLSSISIAQRHDRELARESGYLANFHLSPDKRNVSFVGTYEGRDNIWILPIDGGVKRKISNNTDPRSYYSGLAWSPDGHGVYYGKQTSWSLITTIENFQ